MVHVSLEVEGWSVTLEIDTFYYDNYDYWAVPYLMHIY